MASSQVVDGGEKEGFPFEVMVPRRITQVSKLAARVRTPQSRHMLNLSTVHTGG